ncbi:DUF3857 domain-containing transglutaminase family protein [Mesonia sp.]|uniref:DUF3857 domain-containing transglutaminase family protein n=1 Tax=Mesonia sp. TaxID=1960830 RepID=UPI00175AC017|nr:DUF3857 domain-containing transglutaminase family protein [Mesonia sp.]HIB37649.1 DUF3857 domain-containing protein [Mesonia sp.]HIO26882.1 DUF3857 domain-containing protein [Flavobacteriaceae bacterium]
MNKILVTSILWMTIFTSQAQKSVEPIAVEDFRNADAVIRNYTTRIELENSTSMTVNKYTLVTVLNEKGDEAAFCIAGYDNDIKIKNLELIVYNANGEIIKKIKEKDFTDRSAVDGSTLYSDSRIKYFDYKPTSYPYTVAFTKEYKTSNTAFIPTHHFIPSYDVFVQNSSFKILYDKTKMPINIKEKNFQDFKVKKQEMAESITYSVQDVEAIPVEDLHLPLNEVTPSVLSVPRNFNLSGYKAEEIGDWSSLGKWFSNEILLERTELSPATISKMKKLTAGIDSPLEKAKLVYEYVQNNTRYISVQVGIGGFQPILASEVDEVKYGDCKGLSNYTKALLEAVGVDAYYVHVEAGNSKVNFESDFASLAQGNHAILAIPNQDSYSWIDCTSQTNPFGFLGDFTDDRDVFVMKPDGGEIVKTPAYLNEDNYQYTKAKINFNESGEINVEGVITTKGTQYDNRRYLEQYSPDDLKKRDKAYWSYIDNLTIVSHQLANDKDKIEFTENFQLKGDNYVTTSGERLFISINPISPNKHVPQRYRTRKTPFRISRGYWDQDEIEISIPEGYQVEALPDDEEISSEFGTYKMSLEVVDNMIIYKKDILLKDGVYPKEKYSAYREFRNSVSNSEGKKISFIAKQN